MGLGKWEGGVGGGSMRASQGDGQRQGECQGR